MRLLTCIFLSIYTFNTFGQLTKKQTHQIDSLKKIVNSTKSDIDKINAYKTWDDIIYISNPELDKELNERSKELAEKNLKRNDLSKNEKKIFNRALANSLNNLAYHYKDHGNIIKAKGFANRALKISTANKDTSQITAALNALATIAQDRGDFATAIENYTKCLLFREAQGDMDGTAQILNNIGALYYNQTDNTNALKYYRRSLKIMTDHNTNAQNYPNVLSNVGNIMLNLQKYDSCMIYYNKSLEIQKKAGDKQGVASVLNNIGICYDRLEKYDEAIRNFEKALKLNEEIDDKKGISSSLTYLGETYQSLGEYKKSIACLERSVYIAQSQHLFIETLSSSQSLYQSYKAVGKYKEADEMNVLYTSLKDSMQSDENKKALVEQEFRYAYEKEKAIDKKENEKQLAIAASQKQQQKIILYAVLSGLFMVLVFAVFVVNRLRITRKQKKIIEDQKRDVEHKQKEILDSIHYAQRIQQALMPSAKRIDKILKDKNK
jgi:tetratricopeptide (TPR) repeat protein